MAVTQCAIEFANAVLPAWRARTAKERAVILRRWFDLIMANQDDLSAIMTAEQGKPLAEAKARSRMPKRHRAVRRGGKTHLWRYDSRLHGRPPHHRAEA